MMSNMRKIVLTVSSAKVVNTNNKGNCRKTIVRNGSLEECLNDMDNIIHVNHIVNALHVMFGARPVSFKYGNQEGDRGHQQRCTHRGAAGGH